MIKLQRVRLNSGDSIEIADGLTVIVGPNNAGKSLVLTELVQQIQSQPGQAKGVNIKAVDRTEFEWHGIFEDFEQWMDRVYSRRPPGQYSDGTFSEPSYRNMLGQTVHLSRVEAAWENTEGKLGPLGHFVVRYLAAENRSGMVSTPGAINQLTDRPSHPFHLMYADREFEYEASRFMMHAFGVPLTLNRYAGNVVPLHVGRANALEGMPPSPEYLRELAALPLLQEQGDGIRSFMGIYFALAGTHYPVLVIDEPEAFLHPPQSYLLGRVLAEQHDKGTQVIVATHSSDIVRGVTSAKAATGQVTIVRLTRSELGNKVSQVATETVGALYEDPLIKYYGILDGLFYHGVVLCEADSDCTYYRAVLDSIPLLDDGTSTQSVNIHFTHCGGKARLPKAVRALREAHVPVICVADFDLLQNAHEFDALVTAYGGHPDRLRAWRNDVVSAINSKATPVKRALAKTLIDATFNNGNASNLDGNEISKIREAITARGGWRDAKQQGRGCLSGQAVTSFDSLNAALRELGIFLVERGELERFHPEVPSHNKAEWLRQVLEQQKYLEASDAHDFIKAIASAILNRQ